MNNLKKLIKEIIFLIIWVVIIGTPTYFIKKDEEQVMAAIDPAFYWENIYFVDISQTF
ncbi:MAG: hypothetical protein Q8877_02610 [Sweet potato little leaf phytoplasma]|nr:hypothetical protein [Sweet potato little leaf phytoplasma]